MSITVQVFTSAALNYIPKARLLFRSIRQHHPDWTLHLLLADTLPSDLDISQEPFDRVTPISELGIDEWKGWAFCHTITELATAIKPWMLEKLLIEGGEDSKVIYLDPDTVVFSPLSDIVAALDEAPLVLTPHQNKPEESLPAVIDNEICSLKHGIYNLGFLGVRNTPTGLAFTRWWAERTYYFCRDDIPNGLFTDQRWIDLAPAFFPGVAIMRSSRHNVATWNITTRQLEQSEDGCYTVDGEPLGFYHFTGFDSGAHRIMAFKNGGENPALHKLIAWYTNQIKPLVDDPLTRHSWAFSRFESGNPIHIEQRLVYRMRRDLQKAFPDPFAFNSYDSWWENQARREYPALFIKQSREEAMKNIATPLSPGFIGSKPQDMRPTSAAHLLRQSLRNPQTGLQLGRRAWEIIRNEGIGGIKARLGA